MIQAGIVVFWTALVIVVLNIVCSLGYETTIGETPNFYKAAVFEHAKRGNAETDQPLEYVAKNLLVYENAAKEAEAQSVDIIIFPEYGIIPWLDREEVKMYLEMIPDARKVRKNPCSNPEEFHDRPILRNLSCIAKQYKLVVVANMGDIQSCSREENANCPEDGSFHYNTNVVFDKNGVISAKYYKEHLFLEPGMNFPQETQNHIFSTDFGTFAMYICADALYRNITKGFGNPEVDAVLLPTLWFDYKPFLSSVQFWDALSTSNDVPFLTANGQLTYDANVGSGIFLGHLGAAIYTYNPDGRSKLLISRIPKRNSLDTFARDLESTITVITENGSEPYNQLEDGQEFPETCSRKLPNIPDRIIKRYRCTEESTNDYSLIKLTRAIDFLELCNNGMCCSVNYSTDSMNDVFYFGVFNGSTVADPYSWCTENCFIARCDSFENRDCKTFPLKSNTVFRKLNLKANFTTQHIYPSMLKNNGRLTFYPEKKFKIENYDDYFTGLLTYESSTEVPLTFAGLNGRCFDRDPPLVV